MERRFVVTKQPFEDAKVEEWSSISLADQQSFVGGLIDIVGFGLNDEWSIVLNDEGKFDPELLPNIKQTFQGKVFDIIVGPVLVLKADDDGRSIQLTQAEAQLARAKLNRMAVTRQEAPPLIRFFPSSARLFFLNYN